MRKEHKNESRKYNTKELIHRSYPFDNGTQSGLKAFRIYFLSTRIFLIRASLRYTLMENSKKLLIAIFLNPAGKLGRILK